MSTILVIMEIIFWLSSLIVIYTYIGYPLLIAAWARLGSRRHRREPITPKISFIIAAYNEEEQIAGKLESCFNINYPQELVEIIVISDGSTDKTEEIIEKMVPSHPNLTLVRMKNHDGKALALNTGVEMARGEILIFTDARQRLDPNCARALVANFVDPTVGAVSGELIFVDEYQRPQMGGVGFYWKYEKWIRRAESAVHSTCGATGALYAIRRNLFFSIPEGLILDDVLIPMRAPLLGYRTVFESNAYAYDRIAESSDAEFARKVRTLYGNYQLLAFEPRLLSPGANPIFLQFFSHKVCRLIAPFCLIALLITNIFLLSGYYILFFAMQIFWYLLAIAGYRLNNSSGIAAAKSQEAQ
jgi:poly-beta-1,6-N-acetyl-D-glucosamine synthase